MSGYNLLEQAKIRLRQFITTDGEITFTDSDENIILQQLIDEATNDVRLTRAYPDSFTEDQIEQDLKQFEHIILRLAIYDYNKEGIEGETSDSENGYKRTYRKREIILADVTPYVKVM